MATYVDLDSLHVPSAGTRPPSSWGAQVNANMDYIYDELLAKLGQWTSYTPTLTQSATVSKTVTYARYRKVGRTVIGQIVLACTSAGTAANPILVGLPSLAVLGSNAPCGSGYVYDASAGLLYPAVCLLSTTSVISFLPTTAAGSSVLGAAVMTAALASGDGINAMFHYESAS